MTRLSVLLIDDDPAVLRSVARGLKRYDVDVTTAMGVQEALLLFRTRQFDIVVTDRDTNEPLFDGEHLALATLKMPTKPKVILHSGRPEGVDEDLFDAIVPKGRIDLLIAALGLDKETP